jgi:hypothetical protein
MSLAASTVEAGRTIVSLHDLIPQLERELSGPVIGTVPSESPVLLSVDEEGDWPDALRASLIQSGLTLRAEGGQWRVELIWSESEESRSTRRQFSISPVPLSLEDGDVISTGSVVAFGREIAPPYRITVDQDQVSINGVPVFPTPGDPSLLAAPTDENVSEFQFWNDALTAYSFDLATFGSATARENLTDRFRDRPEVRTAEWRGASELRLERIDGTVRVISIDPETKSGPPPTAAESREFLELHAENMRSILQSDHVLLCGATYFSTVDEPSGPFLERVREIRSAGESDAMRIARLQAWTGHRDAAADLLYGSLR